MDSKWDIRFLRLAHFVSSFSKDPSTRSGAVIIRPDRSICSTGYNGFPKIMPESPELYANREEKLSRIVHSEINASIFAREPLKGYTLATWPMSCCDRCVVYMIQCGISRFIWPEPTADKVKRWGVSFEKTKKYLTECNIPWTEIPRSVIRNEESFF